MSFIFPAITAFALTTLFTWLAVRYFPQWGLLDRPRQYGLKREPIPYPGGVVLYLAFAISVFLFLEPNLKLIGLLLAGALIVLVSFWDDRYPLPAWFRLLVQFLAAVILVWSGIGILSITNPLGGTIALDQYEWTIVIGPLRQTVVVLSALFTIAWIVVIVNAMNWLDGISGLPSGLTAIGALILFFLSVSPIVNQPETATLALIIAAMALAFWLFDFHPPKILIGDSGAMLLGLLLASLAIFSGGKIATAFLVLGFPILDAVIVGISRVLRGRAPWRGGEWEKEKRAVHLHHRLLQAGLSERQVLFLIYFLAAAFGVIALFLGTKGKFWATLVIAGISFALGWTLRMKTDRK